MLNWMFLLIRLMHTGITTMILVKVGLSATKTRSLEVGSLETFPFLVAHFGLPTSRHATLDLFSSWLNLNGNLINISRFFSRVIYGLKLRSGLNGAHFNWWSDLWVWLFLGSCGAGWACPFLFLTYLWNLRLVHVRFGRSLFFLLRVLPRGVPCSSFGGNGLICGRDCIWNHFVVLRVFRSQFIDFGL